MKDSSIQQVKSSITKTANNRQNKITIISFISTIVIISAIVIGIFLRDKNMDKKLHTEGIETVGIIKGVHHYENHKGETDEDFWKASFYFLEMETGEYIHTNKVVPTPPKSAKPGSKYRVRYLAGKAKKTAKIYFNEPIKESAPKSSGN